MTRILILGGGFGGISTAQELFRYFRRDPSVEITLINRENYFVFVPLLASAAAGTLESLHVVASIRSLIPRVLFRNEEILGIDLDRKIVTTAGASTGYQRELSYDHLVLALGNVINLSKLPGTAQHGMTIKTLGDALAIRNHVLQMLESADIETDPTIRREMLTFVVAGGGFSGVEMVGELNDLIRDVIRHYPSITEEQVRVILLHSNNRIIPEMSEGIAGYALKEMRKRGVEVILNVRLAGATPHKAVLQSGAQIATRTLIIAIGNAPPPVLESLKVKKERGKLVVDEFLQVPNYPGVWALGDNAIVPNRASSSGEPSPPTAQFALRQGKALAHNIVASIRRQSPKPFAYSGLGLLCLIGHGAGVGELPAGIKLTGIPGWLVWRGVYWLRTPSIARKIQVGIDWLLDLFLPRELSRIQLTRSERIARAHFERGDYIYREGDYGEHFYIILDGEIEVSRSKTVLGRLKKDQFFGETSLLTGRRRDTSVRCLTPVNLIVVAREDFEVLAQTWLQLSGSLQQLELREEPALAALQLARKATGTISLTQMPKPEFVPGAAHLMRKDSGNEILLDRELLTLGRGPDNNIVVPDDQVSRKPHARIAREASAYWLEDLQSLNGTYVNGRLISGRKRLNENDILRIGRIEFVFHAPEPISQPKESIAPLPRPQTAPISLTRELQDLDQSDISSPEKLELGRVTREIQELDKPPKASPKDLPRRSVTDEIRALDKSGASSPESIEPGALTRDIQSLEEDKSDESRAQEQPPRSVTEEIKGLEQTFADAIQRTEPGGVTRDIQSLDEIKTPDALPQRSVTDELGELERGNAEPAEKSKTGELTSEIRALKEWLAEELRENRAEEGATIEMKESTPTIQQSPYSSTVPLKPLRLILEVTSGSLKGKSFTVEQVEAIIGRLKTNPIFIPDDQVSRRHAKIEFRDGHYWIEDLKSENGTIVNDERLDAPRQMQDGDVIEIVDVKFNVVLK